MHAIILAGGLGTRLRPLVRDLPKPMVEIAGRPFLEYLLLQLRGQGYRTVTLCTGHMANAIQGHFGKGDWWGISIDYSEEPEPRGTAGALKLAERILRGERWLVMNGDSFFDISFRELVGTHVAAAARATLALARVDNPQRYGSVTLASQTEIGSFVEKGNATGEALINGGVYVLDGTVLDLIPPDRPVSLEREVFPNMIGGGLHGRPLEGEFVDIGVPEDYERVRAAPGMLLRLVG